MRAVAAPQQREILSAAVEEGEACDSNPHQIDHVENILLGVASDDPGPARRRFGASPDGLLKHLRYIVTHEDNQGLVVRCTPRAAAAEAGVARSAMDVTEVEMEYYMGTARLDMLHVAYVAAEVVQAEVDADKAGGSMMLWEGGMTEVEMAIERRR